ncbi:MAG TPA: hypothetical protein VK644_12740 [Chitinophagaceae bacterium]|nr:hypothetical protein [Chitinophagaceae bacterium]
MRYFRITVNQKSRIYNFRHSVSSIFMIIALIWLTISVPFVYAAQQNALVEKNMKSERISNDKSSNPLGSNTEEKAPSGINSFSEEYLHHSDELFHAAEIFLSYHAPHDIAEYRAFHGELLCPPPNLIS